MHNKLAAYEQNNYVETNRRMTYGQLPQEDIANGEWLNTPSGRTGEQEPSGR